MERTGILRADGRRVWPEHRGAFQWMNEQMRRRLGPPPRGNRYPVWAWKVYTSDSPRPDLRRTAHLPRGTRGARLEIDVPDERVLLSDFMRWHSVLFGSFLYDDLREDEEMERRQIWRYPERVRESWPRIFELHRGDRDDEGERNSSEGPCPLHEKREQRRQTRPEDKIRRYGRKKDRGKDLDRGR